jgi:hypothetical protein
MAKGLFLGVWLFSFGTIAYLWLVLFRRLAPNTAIGIDLLAHKKPHRNGAIRWNRTLTLRATKIR